MIGERGGPCATRACPRTAQLVSPHELQVRPDAPYRCRACCVDIAARYAALGLIDPPPVEREGLAAVVTGVALLILALIGVALIFAL